MANLYEEFLRTFSESYILIKTETSDLWRPFYIKRQDTQSDRTVIGILLYEGKNNCTIGKAHVVPYTRIEMPEQRQIIAPQSTGVNLRNLAAYITLVPKQQYNKGWSPKSFSVSLLSGGVDISGFMSPSVSYDLYPEISYNCLLNNMFTPLDSALSLLDNGDKLSCCITRNLAVGWSNGVSKPVLYHRGKIKGIALAYRSWSVVPEMMKFKETFSKAWGHSLKEHEIKNNPIQQNLELTQTELIGPAEDEVFTWGDEWPHLNTLSAEPRSIRDPRIQQIIEENSRRVLQRQTNPFVNLTSPGSAIPVSLTESPAPVQGDHIRIRRNNSQVRRGQS